MFLRFEGQIHDSSYSVSTECEVYRIEEGEFVQPMLIARAKFFAVRRARAPNQAFCLDRMRDSRVPAKVIQAVESSKKGGLNSANGGMA